MAKRKYTERFNKTYKTYRKRYFQKKRQFEKLNRKNMRKGIEKRYYMREEVMSKSDFYSVYGGYKEMLADEGIKNPNIVQYIVSDQAYIYSRKQYRGLKASFKKDLELGKLAMDEDFSEIDFRTGQAEIDFEGLLNEYHYLKDELGYTSDESKKLIAQYYFGSE